MKRECIVIQEAMIENDELTQACQAHIAECETCARFHETLSFVQEGLTHEEVPGISGARAIARGVLFAEKEHAPRWQFRLSALSFGLSLAALILFWGFRSLHTQEQNGSAPVMTASNTLDGSSRTRGNNHGAVVKRYFSATSINVKSGLKVPSTLAPYTSLATQISKKEGRK